MFATLPSTAQEFSTWKWEQIEPYYHNLETRELTAATAPAWLKDWTQLTSLVNEARTRLYVATTVSTADEDILQRFQSYLGDIIEQAMPAEQKLKEKLLTSGLQPEGMEIPLRAMRAEADIFREANVPLYTQDEKFGNEYDQISGAQTVMWEGKELTIPQTRPLLQSPDRTVREKVWRMAFARQYADREAVHALWKQYMPLRKQIAENAGFSDYRAYRWKEYKRFDYTPDDCLAFHDAIEQTVVPAGKRMYARWQKQLGVETLRPWDLVVDKRGLSPLRPFKTAEEFESKSEAIFRQVDPQLGDYFATMRREKLLDLDSRKNKAPGGYQIDMRAVRRPFVFMNSVGMHEDVTTILHEGGHAFHCFETAELPYDQQLDYGAEISEVASMSMELLAAPYLAADKGGFYSPEDAARARVQHLESIIGMVPYIATIDALQHWMYTHYDEALDPVACETKYAELWARFMPGVDYSGLEDWVRTRWLRTLHVFQIPFYFIDYALAQVGALQVWNNALKDQAQAVRQYRHALSLGNTRSLPELFAAAGAKFSFDAATLGELVDLVEKTIEELEPA